MKSKTEKEMSMLLTKKYGNTKNKEHLILKEIRQMKSNLPKKSKRNLNRNQNY
jgi:hypothetical protein